METTVIFSGDVVAPSRPISPSSHRQTARGLAPGIIAALRKPWGVSHMSSCHRSASSGRAATAGLPGPSMCHPTVPFTTNVWRACRCSGVPPLQPSPYFHDAGLRPGARSNSSFIVLASQFIVRV
jgi:hypothetical protein